MAKLINMLPWQQFTNNHSFEFINEKAGIQRNGNSANIFRVKYTTHGVVILHITDVLQMGVLSE